MAKSSDEVRFVFAKRDPKYAREYGEKFARQWFIKNNLELVYFDQGRTTMRKICMSLVVTQLYGVGVSRPTTGPSTVPKCAPANVALPIALDANRALGR